MRVHPDSDGVRAPRFVVEKLMWCTAAASERLVNAGTRATTPPWLHAPQHATGGAEQRANRVDPAVVTGGAGAVVTSWLRASSYSSKS
jgi:hypothetical protein